MKGSHKLRLIFELNGMLVERILKFGNINIESMSRSSVHANIDMAKMYVNF